MGLRRRNGDRDGVTRDAVLRSKWNSEEMRSMSARGWDGEGRRIEEGERGRKKD